MRALLAAATLALLPMVALAQFTMPPMGTVTAPAGCILSAPSIANSTYMEGRPANTVISAIGGATATGSACTGTVALSITGANSGGFALSSTTLPANLTCPTATTCPAGAGPYADFQIVATLTAATNNPQPITPSLAGVIYTSNDPIIGFDASAVGTLPPLWVNGKSPAACQVGTTRPTNGHTHTLGETSMTDVTTCVVTGVTASADMTVSNQQIEPTGSTNPGRGLMPMCRTSSDGLNGYIGLLNSPAGGQLRIGIFKFVSGSAAQVGSFGANKSYTFGTTVAAAKIKCSGTTIQAKWWDPTGSEPGVWDVTVTDSSVSAAGYAGVYDFNPTGVLQTMDEFIAQ